MGGRGLEPPCLAAPVPKTGVSTISPPARPIPPTRDRTWDLLLKRELLYQLSYGRDYYRITIYSLLFKAEAGKMRSQSAPATLRDAPRSG